MPVFPRGTACPMGTFARAQVGESVGRMDNREPVASERYHEGDGTGLMAMKSELVTRWDIS